MDGGRGYKLHDADDVVGGSPPPLALSTAPVLLPDSHDVFLTQLADIKGLSGILHYHNLTA